ncbi:MAG TPA: AAA family ATPase [Streptosporangiaceae bacterium]|nr:AAA family ATPase [Streptosporangiaceae bacterium]
MTTNNDTPQTFGEGARQDAVYDSEWRDGAGDLAGAGADFESGPDGLDPTAEMDEARGPDEADPYLPWADWDEPVQMEAGGAAYPQPSFYPHESGYPAEPGYPQAPGYSEGFGYPQVPEYPRGLGFAPIPRDHPGPGEPGYPAGPGYVPDPGYGQDLGYPQDMWNGHGSGAAAGLGYGQDPGYAQDPGYGQDPGYARDAGAVPPMEPLTDWAMRDAMVRSGQAPRGTMPAPMPSTDPEYEGETSDDLTAESLLRGKRPGFGSGWRRGVTRVTGGLLRLGESSAEMRRRDLINRVRTPVAAGHHRVAVLSLKGGVGKTTTAVGLGATLATLRGDRVVAVDANPDRGTLSDKVRLETAATIRDLLNERDQVRRYADIRAFTSQAPSRLEVLASDRDPAVSVAFGADDYCDVARVLEQFYSICLTDCGTGLLHSAMSGVLRLADQIVVVSSPSVDGARSASATLDWLEAHHCGDLVRNGVVVLSTIRPKSKSTVDLDRLERHFAARCRAVVRIPYDAHLEEGAEVELELLGGETADAYLALAAIVGDGLAWPRRMTSRWGLP